MKPHRVTHRSAVAFAGALLAGMRRAAGRAPRDAAARSARAAAALPDVPAEWWKSFNDARLDALVDEALANNRDLARAMARIDESRAVLRSAKASRLPRVDANAVGRPPAIR